MLGIIFGGFAIEYALIKGATRLNVSFHPAPILGTVIAIAAVFGMTAPIWGAWLWWSSTVARWRIWALQNVDNWRALEQAAIAGNVIWPRGSIFEKTEFKTPEERALERALLRARDLDD